MSEELKDALARIACLEGEIAKRDEVIVGLTNSRDFWREKAIAADDELAALKAQEPVSYTYASKQETQCAGCGIRKHTPLRVDEMGGYVCLTCIDKKLEDFYAAPVSEAKAQGVVMPAPDIKTGHGYPAYSVAAVTELFARLNAAPVQQVSVPDGLAAEIERAAKFVDAVRECERLASSYCGTIDGVEEHGGDDHEDPTCAIWHRLYYAMFDGYKVIAELRQLAAAPAAPAADAGHVFYGMDGNHP